jgi:hypothetical protein
MKLPNGEGRVALDKRQREAEMSAEEMRRELLTSQVTGLPNCRIVKRHVATPNLTKLE